jgi:hypothetical protein
MKGRDIFAIPDVTARRPVNLFHLDILPQIGRNIISPPSTMVGSLFSKRSRVTGLNCKTSCFAGFFSPVTVSLL